MLPVANGDQHHSRAWPVLTGSQNVSRVLSQSPLCMCAASFSGRHTDDFHRTALSLATGWMVLIAAEMLAQNPGLGKFIWDEFQNGSSNSLGRIMVAVMVIGVIGFVLDRLMLALQRRVSGTRKLTCANIEEELTMNHHTSN